MRFMPAMRARETAQIFTQISLRSNGQLVSPLVLLLAHLFLRNAMKVELMDIIAGRSFIQMGNGGQLISAKVINVPLFQLITLGIIPLTG